VVRRVERESARYFCGGEGDGVGQAREQRSAQQGVGGVRFVESGAASRVGGTEHMRLEILLPRGVCA
jgi:hypothetical protein